MSQSQNEFIVCVIGSGGDPFLKECLSSVLGVTSEVHFCTVDEDSPSVSEMRRLKRVVPTVFHDSHEEAVYNFGMKGRWVVFLNSNEVLHEDCCHFLWHFSMHHGDNYDGLMFPVFDVETGIVTDSMRGLSPKLMRGDFFDGKFTAPEWAAIAPSSLFPHPLWSMSEGVEVPFCAPRVLNHLYGRTSYSEVYMPKKTRR